MLARNAGQRLFLAIGTPWMDAVIAYLEPHSPYRPWRIPSGVSAGDLLVTILDTRPRTVLCVEVLGSLRRGHLDVVDECELALPLLRDVEAQADVRLPTRPGPIDDAVADRILQVLTTHERQLFGRSEDSGQFSARAARTLALSSGICAACQNEVNVRGVRARDRVHVHLARRSDVDDRIDRSAVLCDACHTAMSKGGFKKFVDYRFSLQPQCPRCAAFRTSEIVFGMPPGPDWLVGVPWLSEGGCVFPAGMSERWSCGECAYEWSYNVDPRYPVPESPRAGDHIAARLLNFDGRRAHMFPPDVDEPLELLRGRLIVEDVDSAWGGYMRHAIRCDDGRLREIEPDTILASPQ